MDNKLFFGSIHRSTIFIFSIVLAEILFIEYGLYSHMTILEDSMAKEIQIKERLLEEQRWLKVEIEALKSPQRIETIAKERLQMYYPPKKVKQKQQQNNRERN